MNPKASDQEWQRIQEEINDLLSRSLRNDVRSIEYRPRYILQLPESTSESRQDRLQKREAISDGFEGRKGEHE